MAGDDKRNKILNAASEIFAQKGLKDSTITEIASRAGVVDSIIYHYFKNKEDLLFCTLGSHMDSSITEINYQFQGIIGATSKLGKLVWYHLNANDNQQGSARIVKQLLLECRANKNFYKHENYKSLKEYAGVLTDILKEGIEEGSFHCDLHIPIARDMIFGLLDEESLSCLTARQLKDTLPDFDYIMSLILAMLEKPQQQDEPPKKNDKARTVLQAAASIFSQKGFNKATVAEIGHEAYVSEGTIYEYYENKQDLLLSIAKDHFTKFKIELDQTFNIQGPEAKLRRMVWNNFLIFFTHSEFLTLFLQDIKLKKYFYTTDTYTYFLNCYSKLFEILDEGKQLGLFRKDVNNRVFRNLFAGSFTHLLIRWLFISKPPPLTFMQEFNIATEMLCQAVAVTEK